MMAAVIVGTLVMRPRLLAWPKPRQPRLCRVTDVTSLAAASPGDGTDGRTTLLGPLPLAGAPPRLSAPRQPAGCVAGLPPLLAKWQTSAGAATRAPSSRRA